MKLVRILTPLVLLFCTTQPVFADEIGDAAGGGGEEQNENIKQLVKYFKHFGGFLGFDVSEDPSKKNGISSAALNPSNDSTTASQAITAFFSAWPMVAGAQFIQGSTPPINSYANAAFPSYNSPGGSNSFTANPLLDQATLQGDPVSQAVLDIIGASDISDCFASSGGIVNTEVNNNCKLLFHDLVLQNVIGTLPGPNTDPSAAYYSYAFNAALIPQLSSNSLIGPLEYTTQSSGSSNSQNSGSQSAPGLTSQSPAQNAANFIYWSTGLVNPPRPPVWTDYSNTFYLATTPIGTSGSDTDAILKARRSLFSYFANIRTYAAQVSVAVSNLYGIAGKRIPLQSAAGASDGGTQNISQAMQEFQMASKRLLPQTDAKGNSNKWIDQINNASPATVQKEIAILLAEINYQLYLGRQQDERLLLTQSIMLIQNAKQSAPEYTLTDNTPASPGSE